MAIRLATPADRPAVERIVADAYAKYLTRIGKPPAPMRDDYGARIAAGRVWVLAESGWPEQGGICGLLVLIPAPDHLLLDNVAVAPARQGGGIGRRLLAFAEAEAARRGLPELRLHTHALMVENQSWYRRLGWSEYARGEQAGFARVFMRKALA